MKDAPRSVGSHGRCRSGLRLCAGRRVSRAGLAAPIQGRRRRRRRGRARQGGRRPRARGLRHEQGLRAGHRSRAHGVRRHAARGPRRRARAALDGRGRGDRRVAAPPTRARTRSSTSTAPTWSRAASTTRCSSIAAANPRRRQARADRHVDARQADLRPQDDRGRAQRRPTARGRRVLFSAINHAREWIAAEVGPAPACAGSPSTRTTRRSRELLAPHRAVVPADPEPGRLRLHVHLRRRRRPTTRATPTSETPTTTASGARRCATTTATASTASRPGGLGDGVDPNRNYPAKRGIDEEGATNQTGGETYRGPYALSEPENLAFDRLQRRIDVPGQHQLPLGRPAAADPGLLHHRLLRRPTRRSSTPSPAPTATGPSSVHAAALVGPLRVQRRHDRQRAT